MPLVFVNGLGAASTELRERTGWSRERAAQFLDVCATTIFRWEHAEDDVSPQGKKKQPKPSRTFSAQLSKFKQIYTQQMQRQPTLKEFAREKDAVLDLSKRRSKKRKVKRNAKRAKRSNG